MSNRKLLTLNLAQESSVNQILPSSPVLSSSQLGWQEILLRHYRLPPHELPEYYPQQHILLIHHNEHPLELERKLDGQHRYVSISTEKIAFVPATIAHGARWTMPIEFTALILNPALVERAVGDSLSPERVELLPQFSQSDPLLAQIGFALKTELEINAANCRFYAQSMASAIAAHLLQRYCSKRHTLQTYQGGLSKVKLRQAIDYVNEYLADNPTLDEIANSIDMSRYHFIRLFKQSTGLTPYQYLTQRRLERAQDLLANTNLTIAEIAKQIGFATHSHFTKVFRQHFSLSPKAYRQTL